ncbi:cob(I)yrinic acid a,c-diamide adenosyltransferase [Candidatus Microgenomates bacterium]|nr:cob(I)yrinic acid a,c-diamide adenosyltransferase [Candidatus Microgenomates bacterium]
MKLKIYTKTGDLGQTSLYGGKRVWKNDLAVEAYGELDELNSLVGLIRIELKQKNSLTGFAEVLEKIQKNLFVIGSNLAGYDKQETLPVKDLEELIDRLEKDLPEIRNFILPGGEKTAGLLHFARSVCRRVERRVVRLAQEKKLDKDIIIYLNRLSDLFFEMARYINWKKKIKETVWSG